MKLYSSISHPLTSNGNTAGQDAIKTGRIVDITVFFGYKEYIVEEYTN